MEIEYKGANYLTFKTGQTLAVIDPVLPGNLSVKVKLDGAIEIVTEDKLKVEDDGVKLLINGPGEYEVSNISVKGIAASPHMSESETDKATIYRLDIGGYRVAVLGHIKSSLSEDQLEGLGVVDILTIPVGGNGYTLDAHEAASVVRQIGPKMVIPTHYSDKAIKYKVPQNEVEGFLKELGVGDHDKVEKLKLKPGSLPEILTVVEVSRT